MNKNLIQILSTPLYWYRYNNLKDPFKAFQKLKISKDYSKSEKSKGVVLITPVRVSPSTNIIEGLIGTFFALKGYDVRYLLCGRNLTFCERVQDFRKQKLLCLLCQREQNTFQKSFGGSAIDMMDYISTNDKREIKGLVDSLSFDKDEDYIIGGVDLKANILAGVIRFTKRSEVDFDKDMMLLKRCAYNAFLVSRFMQKFTAKEKVYKLITSHGIYTSWGSIIETAIHNNIDGLVWERGYLGVGDLLFGENMSVHKNLVIETKDVFSNIQLTEEKIAFVKDYYYKKENPNAGIDFVNYYQGINKDSFDIEGYKEKVSRYKSVIGMFTNIPWDGQVSNGTEHFPTTKVYLKSVMDWFNKNQDSLLVIRAHPAEVSRNEANKAERFEDVLRGMYPELPENVIFLSPTNPITSYNVLKDIDAAVMYGSTMGLELAVRRVPTILVGCKYVSNKDIVFDVVDNSDLYRYLDMAKEHKLSMSDQMYENALKYGYYWLKYRHVTETSTVLNNLHFVKYNFSNTQEFMKDRLLNTIFDGVVNNTKILNRVDE